MKTVLKNTLTIILLSLVISQVSCSKSPNTHNNGDSEERIRLKKERDENERNFIKDAYESSMEKFQNSEPAFMNSFYIGMDRSTVEYISKYLIIEKKIELSEATKNNKSYTGSDYEKFNILDDCDPSCLQVRLYGVQSLLNLNFYWEMSYLNNGMREYSLKQIGLRSENLETKDFELLLDLYTEKYGTPIITESEDVTLNYVFTTSEHTIDVYRNENTSYVNIDYINHKKKEEERDRQEKKLEKIRETRDNYGKKKHQETLDKI